MTTRSLILSPHEIRAALDGTLGLVVRPVAHKLAICFDTPRGPEDVAAGYPMVEDAYGNHHKAVDLCPLGVPGDQLVCRETWGHTGQVWKAKDAARATSGQVVYQVSHDVDGPDFRWWSPATMPSWASRITLEVVGVRYVRCTELSYADALKCGFPDGTSGALVELERFWTAKYGRLYSWDTSWAWAVEVRRER